MKRYLSWTLIVGILLLVVFVTGIPPVLDAHEREDGLAGYWPLKGDCRDHSGNGNHGKNHGVDLERGVFNGRDSHIEVPHSPTLDLGAGDFTLSAWVWTDKDLDDVIGDVLSKFDATKRKGVTLLIKSSAGGYNGPGNDRHVYFGIDNGKSSDWEDCGRPSATSNYVSNSLTVFDGHLYAGTTDAAKEEDWCHVFRYRAGQPWEDCGRVGKGKTRGVGPLIVHNSQLYAATWSYDWTRVKKDELDNCRVYRYGGGQTWEDCGQPGASRRLFGMASFKGRLYVVGDDRKCYVHEGGEKWTPVGEFPSYAHPMAIHDGRLFAGVLNPGGIHAYDGASWKHLGNPYETQQRCNQIHAFDVYRGKLHATAWPEGMVTRLDAGDKWVDCGRLGDATEINGLTVYNGKLYGGTIPRAEVFRYEGEKNWTSIKRFLQPPHRDLKDAKEWSRVTSLTVYSGKLFASMGSCTSSALDAPLDFRGKVFAMEAGKCISYDRDLGTGWKHLVAVRRKDRLELYVNGKKEVSSAAFSSGDYDLSNTEPLKIGFGEMDYFTGKIREVRIYKKSLEEADIAKQNREGTNRVGD